MVALIYQQPNSATQRAEIYEEGIVWIIDDGEYKEIKLDAAAATQLLAFLQLHQERLTREASADRGGI